MPCARKSGRRFLINNHAPVRVFVSDSGKYVVTMDEWHSVGELPVVVYGQRGELIRVHSTDSLGLKHDVLQITITASSYWWNEDSLIFFGPDEETLFIRLHWGKLLLLRLRDGDLMNDEWYEMSKGWLIPRKTGKPFTTSRGGKSGSVPCVAGSAVSQERKIAATICGQEKLKEAIPRLRELLADTEHVEYFATSAGAAMDSRVPRQRGGQGGLRNMDEACEDVVVEQPKPPKTSN